MPRRLRSEGDLVEAGVTIGHPVPPEADHGDEANSGFRPAAYFGDKVGEFRRKLKMTQNDLAIASGVSQSHVSQLEKGALEPRLTTIIALATALDVDPSDLMPKLDRDMKPRGESEEQRRARERMERVREMRRQRG